VKAVAAARAIADQNIRQATIDAAARYGSARQLADAATADLSWSSRTRRATHSAPWPTLISRRKSPIEP
jgi:hypothetical protein